LFYSFTILIAKLPLKLVFIKEQLVEYVLSKVVEEFEQLTTSQGEKVWQFDLLTISLVFG